jgi:hypothetical protein
MKRWRHKLAIAGTAGLLAWPIGCTPQTMQLQPPPVPGLQCTSAKSELENPLWLPSGPNAYGAVFEKVIDIVSAYFEIRFYDRYDGRIECVPRIAPGFEQPWKPGSPDAYGRLHATLQSIRDRCEVKIETAADGGFFVKVVVYKELEDLARPMRAIDGAALFRTDLTIERQFEVIEPSVYELNWIPLGRDVKIEQAILEKLRKCF